MKKQNYLLEGRLLGVQASLIGECSRNPTPVYQLALLWEDAFSFSEFFCERVFQHVCPFHDGWLTSRPIHTVVSIQQFLIKNCLTPMPHFLYSPDLTPRDFLFVCFPVWKEKFPQGEMFCWCGRGETKKGRSSKRHQNWRAQKLFCTVEKCLDRCVASNGEYLEGD